MRKRQIGPALIEHPALFECSYLARWLLATLPCLADKEGRLCGNVGVVGGMLAPDESPKKVDSALEELSEHGLVVRYEVGKKQYLQILSTWEDQRPHPNERRSNIPEYNAIAMQLHSNDIEKPKQLGCNSSLNLDLDLDLNNKKEEEREPYLTNEELKLHPDEPQKVRLTKTDLKVLREQIPKEALRNLICDLHDYLSTTKKTYKNHRATLRAWWRRRSQETESKDEPAHRLGTSRTFSSMAEAEEALKREQKELARRTEIAKRVNTQETGT